MEEEEYRGYILEACRKIEQSLKEIVNGIPETEIYVMLKDFYMDRKAVNRFLSQGLEFGTNRGSEYEETQSLPVSLMQTDHQDFGTFMVYMLFVTSTSFDWDMNSATKVGQETMKVATSMIFEERTQKAMYGQPIYSVVKVIPSQRFTAQLLGTIQVKDELGLKHDDAFGMGLKELGKRGSLCYEYVDFLNFYDEEGSTATQ